MNFISIEDAIDHNIITFNTSFSSEKNEYYMHIIVSDLGSYSKMIANVFDLNGKKNYKCTLDLGERSDSHFIMHPTVNIMENNKWFISIELYKSFNDRMIDMQISGIYTHTFKNKQKDRENRRNKNREITIPKGNINIDISENIKNKNYDELLEIYINERNQKILDLKNKNKHITQKEQNIQDNIVVGMLAKKVLEHIESSNSDEEDNNDEEGNGDNGNNINEDDNNSSFFQMFRKNINKHSNNNDNDNDNDNFWNTDEDDEDENNGEDDCNSFM